MPDRFKPIIPYHLRFAERDKQIIHDRESGMTLAEIGKKYGLTKERVRQICKKTEVSGDA